MPWVLGIAGSHNGAACLLHGNEIAVAVQEERLVRYKRARVWGAVRTMAIRYCLDAAGITVHDLTAIGFSSPHSLSEPLNDLVHNASLEGIRPTVPLTRVSHHRAHALAATVTSGYRNAAILVIDGAGSPPEDISDTERDVAVGPLGESETMSIYHADGNVVVPVAKDFGFWLKPRRSGMASYGSVGGMYSAVALQVFGDPMEAGKVMGLAPFGSAAILNSEFVVIEGCRCTYSTAAAERFDHNDRWPAHRASYRDLAASVQAALEEAVTTLAGQAKRLTGSSNLCFAGGVALNCTANEKLVALHGSENLFVMPAAEDSGTAIGAAYQALLELEGGLPRRVQHRDAMGRVYPRSATEAALSRVPGIKYQHFEDPITVAAQRLAEGQFLGWFDGGSELGPRALGQRSIFADPRHPDTKDRLNTKVKGREPFRPFAPVLPVEEATSWFCGNSPIESPFMLRSLHWLDHAADVVPAVVHVDGTGRLQTVCRRDNERLHRLLCEFGERTGVPILLNTSFNLAGDPIVETPMDALWCLVTSGLDACVLGNFVVDKIADTPDISRLIVDRTFRSVVEYHAEAKDRGDMFLGPSDLGLDPPVPCSTEPATLMAAAAGPRWPFVRYCVVQSETPWGSVDQVLDVSEGRLLAAVPDAGASARVVANAFESLYAGDRSAAVRRLWKLSSRRVISIRAADDPRRGHAASDLIVG